MAVHWGALEGEKGNYDFAALEERWNFAYWKEQGVHLVLRVVADEPGDEAHMDIPQWLYEEMEGRGTWYQSSYGKGFSPDYTHPAMIEAHSRLMAALGERYDGDPQVAYVQLGSLGHWGEWHVNQKAGIAPFPKLGTAEQYIAHYVDAFSQTPMLMRRPFPAVNEEGLGLYHDTLGREESDGLHLDWIREGYVSDQTGEKLPACLDFWKYGPSGGELASGIPMEDFFTEGFPHLLSTVKALHTSWIGPHCPKGEELSEKARENMELLSAELGYCYTLRSLTVKKSLLGGVKLNLAFENLGIAPMYASWPLRIELRDQTGQVIARRDVPANQKTWLKEGNVSCRFSGQMKDLEIWVGIVDPMTNTCRVALANDLTMKDGMYRLN